MKPKETYNEFVEKLIRQGMSHETAKTQARTIWNSSHPLEKVDELDSFKQRLVEQGMPFEEAEKSAKRIWDVQHPMNKLKDRDKDAVQK